nr:hypothetical protein [Tanacetum cinerariifolium]
TLSPTLSPKVNRKRKTKEHHCHYPQQQMTNL